MEDDIVIRVKDMSKSFRIVDPAIHKKGFLFSHNVMDFTVFEDVNLEVRKGEVLGILGRNGCGKSTFMKIISGIIEPDSGTIEVEGKVASILELSMGFHNDLTGRENIFLRSELYGIPREKVKEHIDEIVEYSDLGIFIDNPVRTYSSGMRSRLAFSIMVNVDADVFMVDEALSTGDMAFASKASEHLRNLVRSGKTVLFTSHSLSTIKRTCTRAIWIRDHRIVMDGDPEEVCDEYSRSINESFEETEHLAGGGSSSAQYRVAVFYRDGKGTEKNPEKYRFWLEAASKNDHPMAMAELADLIVSEDPERAKTLYRLAAENGNNDARRKYAMYVGADDGSITRLRDVLKDLSESGYPYDLYNYADFLYRTAIGMEQRAEAFRCAGEASRLGWSDADLLLGRMYREGFGTEIDYERSTNHFIAAAELGNSKAMMILADQFYDGKYVRKDREEAFKWYMRSALTGNQRAQYQVALMLSEGDGVEMDQKAAMDWYKRYASTQVNDRRLDAIDIIKRRNGRDDPRSNDLLKDSSRCYNLKSMKELSSRYTSGKGFKKNPAAGVSLMEKAALGPGSPRTQLAAMYLSGENVEKDEQKALNLLSEAAASGDARAMYLLGCMYRDGTAVEPDVEQYRRLIRMAAESGDRDASELVRKWKSRKKH
ncbi:MAG: ATP-binding cassette domain-containing protein [Thermoplasmata archaeon]|nr:ATP-binding cassette domain-containing protein [Thermoplasmata archaeon]